MYAPIILFVYKRFEHIKKTIESLCRCELADESILYIFSDGPKAGDEKEVARVREYLRNISGFREVKVVERSENYGIEKSVIVSVTEILSMYPAVIVLEDDLIVAKTFLSYMNYALDKYLDKKDVFYISAYNYWEKASNRLPDSMLLRMPSTWGWATWRDRWKFFCEVPDGVERILNDSRLFKRYAYDNAIPEWAFMLSEQYEKGKYTWDVLWYIVLFNNKGLVLIPNSKLVKNIGFDGSGEHGTNDEGGFGKSFDENVNIIKFPDAIEEDRKIQEIVCKLIKRQRKMNRLRNKFIQLKRKIRKRRK